MAEVALAHRGPLGPQLRHGRGDDRGVEVGEREAAQREQVAQRGAELVGGRLAHGGEAPVLDELVAVGRCPKWVCVFPTSTTSSMRGREVRLAAPCPPPRSTPCRPPTPARRWSGAPAQGRRLPPRRHAPGRSQAGPAVAPLRRHDRAGRRVLRRREGARLARDPARARAARARAAAAPGRRARARRRRGGRALGRRGAAAAGPPGHLGRARARHERDDRLRRATRTCRSPTPLAGVTAPLVARAAARFNGRATPPSAPT